MMMITAFGAINECPCCHDKDYTDKNGNQKTNQKNKNSNQCILVLFHRFNVVSDDDDDYSLWSNKRMSLLPRQRLY